MLSGLTLRWQNFTNALAAQTSGTIDDWVKARVAQHQQEDYLLWFDSAADNHPNSRFHILLRRPQFFLQATERGAKVLLNAHAAADAERLQSYCSDRSLLQAANAILVDLQAAISVEPHTELPFNGGFAGYLSYDLGRQIEHLPALNPTEYQLPYAGLGFYTEALVVDKQRQQLWVLAADGHHQAYFDSWLNKASAGATRPFTLTAPWQSNLSRAQYSDRFARVQAYLTAGDCYQINLAQRFSAAYEGSEWQAYDALRRVNGAPFSAFMRLPQSAILSVSPERFLAVDRQRRVETKPIKGTRPRHPDPQQDQRQQEQLRASAKDQAENLMIVDLLRNDLSRSCAPGSIEVPHLFAIESFPAVHHLVSTVVGTLGANNTAFDLFEGAFPGGSITGAPKVRAMEIIEELEPNRRACYCGSMAYFSLCGASDSSITIRTLLAEQNTLYCWAGGGLVIDSEDAAEYQETLDKVARILPVLEQP
ncbi:aminodeoxychorismate synthase component I [Idiomarina aquatica]|uniref:aminodeoxychorismate synthase n=1 Tax=Idiomarina aquatica TaxID=1327752 RepID=A0AA94JDA8_9GAMM|nr:aminodeoxychorismate synthase component I [Idiomarina aquatica]RUO43145.1 aminodeoxychorismate synthase, component I [Idiomarina aquatica]